MRTLPRLLVTPVVAAALAEDLGRAGDLTTDAIIPADRAATVRLVSREPGVVAGLPLAELAWSCSIRRCGWRCTSPTARG